MLAQLVLQEMGQLDHHLHVNAGGIPILFKIGEGLNQSIADAATVVHFRGHVVPSFLAATLEMDDDNWSSEFSRHRVYGTARLALGSYRNPSFTILGQDWYFGYLEHGFECDVANEDGANRYAYSLSMLTESEIRVVHHMGGYSRAHDEIALTVLGCPDRSRMWREEVVTEQEANEMTNESLFIETWQDNREAKVVDHTGIHPCYYHEFARCETCNGEIEMKLPERLGGLKKKAWGFKCPHCNEKSNLMTDLLNRYNGGE